jgi:hypothetical protein
MVSSSYSYLAFASVAFSGMEAMEWPKPSMYLLDMDDIMDTKWGGALFPDDGSMGLPDPIVGGFNQGDDWL